MSAVRSELISLNVNGQHPKLIADVHCANGAVTGVAQKRKRNRETIFLFGVILAQTVCMVVGFIVFAYFVDRQLQYETQSRLHLSDRINGLSSELELLKRNLTSKSNRTAPRGALMPPLHGKAEVMKVVTVETVEEYPEIENLRDEREYDESDEEDDSEDEPPAADNTEIYVNGKSGSPATNLNADISHLSDHRARHRPDLPRNEPPAANSATNASLNVPPDDSDEDEGKQTADNTEIYINHGSDGLRNESLEPESCQRPLLHRSSGPASRNTSSAAKPTKQHSQRRSEPANAADRDEQTDEKPSLGKSKHAAKKESEMLQRNTNREEERGHFRSRVARSAPEKRHVNPVQDSGQPRLNSISPAARGQIVDSEQGSLAAISDGSWPAAHFNSYDLSSQRTNSADDCPKEIQNNRKKWAPSDVPGSEHFDLQNSESVTVKKGGLYFLYGQIYFYKDRSIFGFLIRRDNQALLQCSIHTPTNRTSNGSGTTCFTAGLVLLKANDVLRLEIFTESGKCVRWGPGKSFIGLFKLPKDSSTLVP